VDASLFAPVVVVVLDLNTFPFRGFGVGFSALNLRGFAAGFVDKETEEVAMVGAGDAEPLDSDLAVEISDSFADGDGLLTPKASLTFSPSSRLRPSTTDS